MALGPPGLVTWTKLGSAEDRRVRARCQGEVEMDAGEGK